MFLSVRDQKTMREARKYVVIDKDTGEPIPRVIWANEETGFYCQYVLNGKDEKFIDPVTGEVAETILKGNIELRRIEGV